MHNLYLDFSLIETASKTSVARHEKFSIGVDQYIKNVAGNSYFLKMT